MKIRILIQYQMFKMKYLESNITIKNILCINLYIQMNIIQSPIYEINKYQNIKTDTINNFVKIEI